METPYIQNLVSRALACLRDGLPVHLCGPAGGGKTTLALHLAHQLGLPRDLFHFHYLTAAQSTYQVLLAHFEPVRDMIGSEVRLRGPTSKGLQRRVRGQRT